MKQKHCSNAFQYNNYKYQYLDKNNFLIKYSIQKLHVQFNVVFYM